MTDPVASAPLHNPTPAKMAEMAERAEVITGQTFKRLDARALAAEQTPAPSAATPRAPAKTSGSPKLRADWPSPQEGSVTLTQAQIRELWNVVHAAEHHIMLLERRMNTLLGVAVGFWPDEAAKEEFRNTERDSNPWPESGNLKTGMFSMEQLGLRHPRDETPELWALNELASAMTLALVNRLDGVQHKVIADMLRGSAPWHDFIRSSERKLQLSPSFFSRVVGLDVRWRAKRDANRKGGRPTYYWSLPLSKEVVARAYIAAVTHQLKRLGVDVSPFLATAHVNGVVKEGEGK